MICGALVVVFLGLVGQQPAEPLVLSIDDAVSMALEQNRSVRRSAQAVEEAMAALRRTQAYQGVRLDSNAQVSAQGPSSEINFPLPSGGSRSITTIPSLSWSFGLTVSQPIYHGGQLYYQERLAALGLDTARIEQQRQQQAVVRDVRSLFLSVVHSQQLERVAAENVSRSMRHLQDARARVQIPLTGAVKQLGHVLDKEPVARPQQGDTLRAADRDGTGCLIHRRQPYDFLEGPTAVRGKDVNLRVGQLGPVGLYYAGLDGEAGFVPAAD